MCLFFEELYAFTFKCIILTYTLDAGRSLTHYSHHTKGVNLGEKCDVSCKNKYSDLGVELFIAKDWKEVLLIHPGFYDVVIVSRPSTMEDINKVLLGANKSSKFAVVYNAEYQRCRRGALLQEMY